MPAAFNDAVNDQSTAAVNRRGWRDAGSYAVLAVISLAYLLLIAAKPMIAGPGLDHDELLFLRLSEEIAAGRWLGAYNQLTLAKGPGYPLWLAAISWLGVPLQIAQGIVYLGAGWIVAFGVRRLGVPGWACIALFAAYLAVPGATATITGRVLRDGLYTPLIGLMFGAMIWHFALRHRGVAVRAIPALLLGAVLFWLWITREEVLWLTPGVALFAVGLILSSPGAPRGRRIRCFLGDLVVLGIAAACVAGGVYAIGAINQRHYGVRDISEFRQSAQIAAYAAISRVVPDRYERFVIAPKDVREKLYAASPAFARLRAELDGPMLKWAERGCDAQRISPCDNNYRIGHFIWALRDAAAATGHFKTGADAKSYFKTVALEIDTACDAGKLKCLPKRHTLAPPYRSEYLDLAEPWLIGLAMMGLRQENLPNGAQYAIGDRPSIDAFRRLTHAPLYPRGRHLFVTARVAGPLESRPKLSLDAPDTKGNVLRVEWFPANQDRSRDFMLETDCLAPECRLLVVTGDQVRLRLGFDELKAGQTIDATGINLTVLSREELPVERAQARRVARFDFVQNLLTRAYQAALPYAAAAAMVLYLFSLLRAIWRRKLDSFFVLATIALALAATRVALLAYMQASSFFVAAYYYLSPFYPLSVLFTGLAAIGGVRDLIGALRRRVSEPEIVIGPSPYVATAIEREKM
ncbi:MAG: hypothetical protein AB7G15_18075 [Alphaproteobacteria bacterium]